MKKILGRLFFSTAILFLVSCSSDDDKQPSAKLEIASGLDSGNNMEVDYSSGTSSFSVVASSTPQVNSDAAWLTATATQPSSLNNVSRVNVTVEANSGEMARSGHLTLTVSSLSLTVTVNQKGTPKQEEPVPDDDDDNGDEEEFGPSISTKPASISGSTAREVAHSMGMGWNLGNQMDAFNNGVSSETAWGNKVATQQLFNVLKEQGFSTVRIPVTWLGHIGTAPEYKIDEAWLGRVVEIVGMVENAGLNAIVNIHHDGADSNYWLDIKNCALNESKQESTVAEIKAVWSQIAEALKDKGDFLMLEAFNEIHDGGWGWGSNRNDGGKQYACLNEWNQAFVDAVRSVGGNNATRWLGVPSYVTNIDFATDGSMVLPSDDAGKVMVAVHFYEPNDFGLNSKVTDWGHTGDNSKKGGWIADEDYVRSQFRKLTDKWVENNVPVYIGEMGPPNQGTARGKAFRNYYLEYVTKAASEAGVATIYWDNGAVGSGENAFGLFSHDNGTILNNSQDAIRAMLTGATCDDEDYTLEWVYANRAPVF